MLEKKIFLFLIILFYSISNFIFPRSSYAALSASNSTVTVEPSSVPANGTSTSKITVKLLDDASTPGPVNNHRVEISLVGTDSNLIINGNAKGTTSLTVTTGHDSNAANVATFTVKSNSVQTDKFNIKDLDVNVSLSQASVNFTSPSCGDAVPGAPTLSSATSPSSSQVKLTWTTVSDPVSYYVVSYGLSSGNYIYGNPNVGKQDNYTIGYLSPGVTYYFVVKAMNGCSAGASSNELAVVAGQSATPTPTPAPTGVPTKVPTSAPTLAPIVQQENINGQVNEETVINTPVPPTGISQTSQTTPTKKPEKTLIGGLTAKNLGILVLIWGLVFAFAGVFIYLNFRKPKIKTIKISDKDEDLEKIDVKD
ncbi:MAG: fibronectin type III domain-containing protein [Candidatus Levybacteria bacterium]|nr:fibronectin type III domain-containing protein [Candidatus Levybacteria bacterium]